MRYADDFVITGYSRELPEDEVKPLVEAFLMERGLTLFPEKSRITHISQGLDFLGQNIRKYQNGKLLIKPSKRNVQAFLTKVLSHQRQRIGLPGQFDRPAQSDHRWPGELPQTRRFEKSLQCSRYCHLAGVVAVVLQAASVQRRTMDQSTILPPRGSAALGICC